MSNLSQLMGNLDHNMSALLSKSDHKVARKKSQIPQFMFTLSQFKTHSQNNSFADIFDSPLVKNAVESKYKPRKDIQFSDSGSECDTNEDSVSHFSQYSTSKPIDKSQENMISFTSGQVSNYASTTKSIVHWKNRTERDQIKSAEPDTWPFETVLDDDIEENIELERDLSHQARSLHKRSERVTTCWKVRVLSPNINISTMNKWWVYVWILINILCFPLSSILKKTDLKIGYKNFCSYLDQSKVASSIY